MAESNIRNEPFIQKIPAPPPPPPAPVVTDSIWGTPDESRFHRFQPASDINLPIQGTSPYHLPVGIEMSYCNGGALVLSEVPTETHFDDNYQPAALVSYFDLGLRDRDHVTAFMHKCSLGIPYNEFFVEIVQAGWYLIDFTAVLTGPGGSNTQTVGICLVTFNADQTFREVLSPSSGTMEPAADGQVLTLSNLRYYRAGQYIKPAVVTTHQVNLRYEMNGFGGSYQGYKTNFHITRVSNDPPATP